MSTSVPNRRFTYQFLALLLALFAGFGRVGAAVDDSATQGIWKLKYGVTNAQLYIGGIPANGLNTTWLNADDDGDGIKNKDEIAAGTNPFSAGSAAKITAISVTATTVNLTFSTEIGKQYVVQGTPSLTTAFGLLSPSVTWIGTGGSKTLTNITKGTNKYFRILVQDIDTDGDGVSDWAETVAGLNPAVAETVSGLSTLAYVNQQLALPSNVVTIAASNPFASEDGPTAGTFTITRSQSLLPITVSYNVGGTAVSGTDYAAIAPTTATFSTPGVSSMDVTVTPTQLAPATIKGSRSVTATLQAPSGSPGAPPFALGANSSATVIINPSTVPTGTGLLGRYYDTSSTTQADAANFGEAGMYAFTRGTPTTSGTIIVTFSGGAVPGLTNGNVVKMSFTSGSLNNAAYQNLNWTVGTVTASSFTASITGVGTAFSFATTNGNCNFNIQSFTHPATVTRLDSTVNFDWQYGTPNGNTIAPNNSADNYSSTWECYLNPTVAGAYKFQIDADDKAEVLLDTGSGLVQIAEHNWNSPGADTVGTFKQGFTLTGASTTLSSAIVNVPSTAGLAVGMGVTGTGLPAGEIITAIGSGQITVTTPAVSTQASTALTFTGGAVTLAVPATPAQRYRMVVHHVETTGDARCRLQWLVPGTTAFVNIPQANQFTHTQALSYSFVGGVTPKAIITPTGGHTFNVNDTVALSFSTGVLFTPGAASTYNGTYTVTAVGGNSASFTVPNASTTAGSPTVLVPSTAGIAVGMAVSGTGIPGNEYVTAIGVNQITITTGTGVTLQASTTLTFTSNFTVAITGFSVPIAGATTTAGSPNILVPSTTGLAIGMAVSGTGLPANEFITGIIPSANGPGIISVTTGTGVTAQASTALTASLPGGPITGGGFVLNVPTPPNTPSPQTGLYNLIYPNTAFTGSPGRVGVDAAVTNGNNGIWNSGTPDVTLIQPDTFSARWTGQVQPQFSETYTFVVQADEGCSLWINGQPQILSMYPSANTGGSTYLYDNTTGNLTVAYSGLVVNPNSFIAGETVRLDPSTGNLNHAPTTSPTYDYDPTTGDVVVDYTNLTNSLPNPGATRLPGTFLVGESVELDPVSGSLSPLSALPYTITAADTANNKFTFNTGGLNFTPTINVATISTGSPCTVTTALNHNLTTGTRVRFTGVSGGAFSPAINDFYTITVTGLNTFTVASNCTTAPVAGSGKINASGNITVSDNRNAVILASPAPTATTFTVNIGAGKYANASAGNINLDIVNKPLKEWSSNGNERYVRIPMIGGVRYDIQLDAYENTAAARCILSWFSPSQTKQVIPAERLYPTVDPTVTPLAQLAPTVHVSPTDATALVGGLFTHTVAGSNGATVTISGNPAWLTYNSGTGLLSGTPPVGAAGDYQITITITNGTGTSTSVVNLHVDANGGNVVREYWSSVSGTTVASIPTSANPTGSANLTTLEAPTGFGVDYGARIRGYITAPVTGNYYFWIAANNAAELWISNDDEPVNALKRAWVTTGSTVPRTWGSQATQKTPWLALEQGKKYYVEILHKAGTAVELGGSGNDNLAVGWAKPGEATTAPSEVVPGYVLSPYVAPAVGSTPGTLYLASMLAQSPAVSNGVGTSTLRLSDDETVAYMRFSATGLSGSITQKHIHIDPNPGHNDGEIVYDIDTPANAGDGLITNPSDPNFGAYKWTILPVGTYTVASQLLEAIKDGKAYINLHTVLYGNGEIRGNYTLANGTRTFSVPAAPPAWTDDSGTDNGAARFLGQASFGANTTDIAAFKALSATGAVPASGIPNSRYNTWIENQFLVAPTPHLAEVLSRELADAFGPFDVKLSFNTWWKTSMTAPDQLRQRVAFALSQIHVVSGQGPLEDNSVAISDFYDTLAANAFGNFRDILLGTTMTPGMGRYLDMLGNDKPDISVGRSPNENYAREIKQLFSIGLYRMWPDGTLILDSSDSPVPTYTQREIVGFAHVFTGWYYGYDGDYRTGFNASADWTRPMREVPVRHFTGQKRVLNNEVLPGLATLGGQPLDPYATHISSQYNDPTYQALAAQELNAAHDQLFNHPNVGPFICRQLIQRLVTSSPSRDYLYRVVQKFNDNGSGVRGDMKAVIKAIFLDNEARSNSQAVLPVFGKQREPILRVAQVARALRPVSPSGTYAQAGTTFSGTVNGVVYTGMPIITVTTATAHLLEVGNSVFLEFTDATAGGAKPAPSTGTYTVLSVPSTTTYTIAAPGWISGSYNQTAGSNVMTVTLSGHWLPGVNASQPSLPNANWGQAYFDFTTGTAHNLAGFDQTVRTVQTSTSFDTASGVGNIAGTTFTITAPDTTARSGNVMIARFSGSYRCTVRAGDITIDTVYGATGTYGTMADHGLSVGDQVFINFANSRDTTSFNETSTENDLVYTITSVPDSNTFTVQARDAANAVMQSDNQAFIFPFKTQPLVRNGTIVTRQSTFTMNNTDTELQQTPLNSTTVFNYFLPDYKFAGTLASQGLTTPEFQLTSETTVIRQSNFFYNGIFNPGNISISSFNAGTNALVLDLSPWTGNAVSTAGTVGAVLGAGPQTGQKWTSNANLPTLIDRMSTLLLGGGIPAGTKTEIVKFLGREVFSVTQASPAVFTLKDATTGTAAVHGLVVGDQVTISGITGGTWTGASTTGNGTFFVTAVPTTTTFRLATLTTGGTNLNCTNNTTAVLTNSTVGFSTYTNASPSNTEIRDRLRSILHFILTSPDYTIQR